jgi:hypothetical protein
MRALTFARHTTSFAPAALRSRAAGSVLATFGSTVCAPRRHILDVMGKGVLPGEVPAGKQPKFTDPDMTHFRVSPTSHPLYDKPAVPALERNPVTAEWENPSKNAVWTKEEMAGVAKTHRVPRDVVDHIALGGIKLIRFAFDIVSGYAFGRVTERKIMRRILFLETAAGIPGMVAGSLRHLTSLRRMRRDHGWIHTLLEEAENERMHMLVFMHRYQPGLCFRGLVLLTQGVFWNVFFLAYLASPRLCHRFVGYLEEEAVRTYTHIIELLNSKDPRDADLVAFGKKPADEIAIRYWRLPADATMYDVLMAVRADEANHRDVNHTLAGVAPTEKNPFVHHKAGPVTPFAESIKKPTV